MVNEIGAALRDELSRHGATNIRFVHGGKHPQIRFTYAGRERFYPFPGSPSDAVRGIHNALSDVRRMLGLRATVKRIGERRPRKSRAAPRPVVAVALDTPIRSDPLAVLRQHALAGAAIRYRLDQLWTDLFLTRAAEHGHVPALRLLGKCA